MHQQHHHQGTFPRTSTSVEASGSGRGSSGSTGSLGIPPATGTVPNMATNFTVQNVGIPTSVGYGSGPASISPPKEASNLSDPKFDYITRVSL